MGEGGYEQGVGGAYVGRGWSNGQGSGGYSLNPRAVLTNVSLPFNQSIPCLRKEYWGHD